MKVSWLPCALLADCAADWTSAMNSFSGPKSAVQEIWRLSNGSPGNRRLIVICFLYILMKQILEFVLNFYTKLLNIHSNNKNTEILLIKLHLISINSYCIWVCLKDTSFIKSGLHVRFDFPLPPPFQLLQDCFQQCHEEQSVTHLEKKGE